MFGEPCKKDHFDESLSEDFIEFRLENALCIPKDKGLFLKQEKNKLT